MTIQGRAKDVDPEVSVLKDGLYVTIKCSASSGSFNQDVAAIDGRGIVVSPVSAGRVWGLFGQAKAEDGSEGQLIAGEFEIRHTNAAADDVKELIANQKVAIKAVAKEGGATAGLAIVADAATSVAAAFYKGIVMNPAALVSGDTATRFIELTDVFEVRENGDLMVGKGQQGVKREGVELLATGSLSGTASGAAQSTTLYRTDQPGTPFIISNLGFQAKDDGANSTQFAALQARALIDTDGNETGLMEIIVQTSGSSNRAVDLQDRNMGLNGNSYGGGEGVVFLSNAQTNPGSNPTGGGILYVSETGNLTFRGSGGLVTNVASAAA
jgi:hypothetical protein